MTKRVLIMAGGTGGHIFPGLALARRLEQDDIAVTWLGTPTRMEAQIIPNEGLPIEFVDVVGLRGNGLGRLLKAPALLLRAVWQAWRILGRVKPDLVIGFGGFASGPGGVAARLRGIPLLVHEQNAVPGLTNKLLAKIATRVMTGFDKTFPGQFDGASKFVAVGNPVRSDIVQLKKPESAQTRDPSTLNVLIVGGSLGARVFNQALPEQLAQFTELSIRHQCGKGNAEAVAKAYHAQGLTNVSATDFIDDMAQAYGWADVVICRAGALTVSEIAAAGIAAVFVPLPHAVDDHQTANANVLVSQNAAKILSQDAFEKGEVISLLRSFIDTPELLRNMANNAQRQAKPFATEDVARVCYAVLEYAA